MIECSEIEEGEKEKLEERRRTGGAGQERRREEERRRREEERRRKRRRKRKSWRKEEGGGECIKVINMIWPVRGGHILSDRFTPSKMSSTFTTLNSRPLQLTAV